MAQQLLDGDNVQAVFQQVGGPDMHRGKLQYGATYAHSSLF
jgi:hypothetical protein